MNIDQYVKPTFTDGAGDRLKEVREAYNRSQLAVASELGVSQSYISKIEKGSLSEGIFTLADFKKIFRNDVIYILAGEK